MSLKYVQNQDTGDRVSFRINMRQCAVISVAAHLLALYGLSFIKLPPPPAAKDNATFKVKIAEALPRTPIHLVFLPRAVKPEPKPKLAAIHHPPVKTPKPAIHPPTPPPPPVKPVVQKMIPPRPQPTHRTVRLAKVIPTTTAPKPVLHPARVPAAHPVITPVQRTLEQLHTMVIVQRPDKPVEPTFHPTQLPDPSERPDPRADIRSPGLKLPDGMRLDRDTPLRATHALPHGVAMRDLPTHELNRQNGEGNSHNAAQAGPKMAMLDRRPGMGADSFHPSPFSAGGGHTSAPGAADPAPGAGASSEFRGVTDRLGSAEPSSRSSSGGPPGFSARSGRPHPGLTGVLTSPISDWKVPIASGKGGSQGAGHGSTGRGGGGLGGPHSPAGAFLERGRGGGPGEGSGGGIGGGVGAGIGRGFGSGIGGGDGGGGGGGGAGSGSGVGAGYGHGRPGTLGDGIPDGVGDGGGGGRPASFHPGGGGRPLPGGGNPGQTMTAYEIGCVLTNQRPAFNAARWHNHSMNALLHFVGQAAHIKVKIPAENADSYVNLIDNDINRTRPFTYDDIRGFPMIFITGDRVFTLTAGERAALKRYVYQDGGTIYGEDCHSPDGSGRRGGFDVPFHRLMQEIFDQPLTDVPITHPLYHILFNFTRATMPCGDMRETAPFQGITVDGRVAVVYTINDYGDVWSPAHTYYPAKFRPPAYEIGTNLYLYALTNYLAAHKQ